MASINKLELVNAIAVRLDISKVEAERNLTALQEIIVENIIAGNEVKLSGFIHLYPTVQKARTVKNPANGEEIEVPEKTTVRARVLGKFKDRVSGKR